MTTANKVLEIAKAEIGYKESPKNSNKTKYGKAYGMDGQPWCAIFVWWVFTKAGCPELFFGGEKSAYCPTIADYYIAQKQTVAKGSGKPGDIVLFDWNKNNSSDHIGIIEKKNSDGSYTTIEGNTSTSDNSNGGQVMRRTRKQADISWICRPKYTEKTTTAKATTTEKKEDKTVDITLPVLKKGDKGKPVKTMQLLIEAEGISVGSAGADGDFGAGTDRGLEKYQAKKGLTVDRVCGTKTWEKLLK